LDVVTDSTQVSQRYPADVVAALPIPSSAKDLLTDVGLPVENEFFMAADDLQVTPDGQVRIGTDYGTDVLLDAEGRVRSVSTAGEYPERFINSNLAAFLQSIALVTAKREEYEGEPDDVLDEQVEVLATTLLEIDENVFDDPENWWSVIFEQMRDGLL
jgi:hypothetical protein